MMYKVKLFIKKCISWIFAKKWRIVLFILLIYTVISEIHANSSTWSLYDNNVSSTALNYLTGCLENNVLDDYIIFHSSQYGYTLVYGELEYSDGVVTGDEVTYITYTTSYQQYSSSVTSGSDSDFYLSVGSSPLYSNLSDSYSDVINRKEVICCVALGTFFITYCTYRMCNSLFVD